jgi:alpha-maltose-1-phosphate synthase
LNRVILSHSGKQHSYHVARALFRLKQLDKFYTSSYIRQLWLQNLINKSGNQFWSKRFLSGLAGNVVQPHWRFELKEILYSKLYGHSQKILNAVYERDVKFDALISKKLQRRQGNIFWGFQGSCYESLNSARDVGKKTICELATGHVPASLRILGEERRLHPDWADSFDNLNFPPSYLKRLEQEPHRADFVVGASSFTLETLRQDDVDVSKLKLLPLGFEAERIPYKPNDTQRSGPLKLLYAGRVTQRKGIVYLLEAMQCFSPKDVELHIVGFVQGSGKGLGKFTGQFTQHPPVSQYELFSLYQHFDAFVLPTLFEGFGLVIIEAMAAGLPVITTPHSIGPEIITDRENGFIVPIRDSIAIKKTIEYLLSLQAHELLAIKHAARKAALNYSWHHYTKRLEALLLTL